MISSHNDAEYWEAQDLRLGNSLKKEQVDINGEEDEVELIKCLVKALNGWRRQFLF